MRYLCIHGHFYQPPRENPWLEAIELQDSAYPYHDWNERITAECYAPNAAARILDGQGRIVHIVNNYSQIDFNFGPTLLAWAKEKAPGLHQLIIDADIESRKRFSGHGSAIAQAYNHIIMPLANSRDKYTQVLWGIEDFKFRFGRDPEGMWLPETAVDLETLDMMAGLGIKFTILAQNQAHLVRRIGGSEWVDVTGGRIDPTRPYKCATPSGKTIAIFFYDGPISRAVAFEGLLNNGEVFGQRLVSGYSATRDWDELAHIATDGESYGHHHRYGEMALSYALHHIEENGLARLTNYGEFLQKFPPTHEVEIYENTAWSCAHGVGRWIRNCGCNTGGHAGWNQEWRGPLREALDWLRDEVAPKYERLIERYLKDAWAARNEYVQVVLNRNESSRSEFLEKHAKRTLTPAEQVEVWKLLELQRHAMLMYTSCGWFFDELSGIETVQVIQYAGRVLQLAQEIIELERSPEIHYAGRDIDLAEDLDDTLESKFLSLLQKARSNVADHRDGARIYEKFVKPAFVDLRKVGAHYAISSVFNSYPDEARVYCYTARREDFRTADAGKLKIIIGRARFTSEVTQESGLLTFGVLHFGDHNLHGGIREFRGLPEYERICSEAMQAFSRADVPEVIRAFDRGFGADTYSLKSLFRDEQRNILSEILISTLDEAEAVYRQLYEHHAPLMRFLGDLKTPLPKAFRTTAEYALNSHLRRAFSADELDINRVRSLLEEARLGGVDLDATTLEFTLRKTIERMMERLREDPANLNDLQAVREAVEMLGALPFTLNLWAVQNVGYDLLQATYPEMVKRAQEKDADAAAWIDHFRVIAEKLSLRID
jgi:alpha-amylase/alpha-mannosidase (GH57 family)